jgi:NADH:ubiquinone oxidoreductase subunit D
MTDRPLEAVEEIPQVNNRIGKDGKVYDTEKRAAANKKRAAKTTTSKTTTTVKVENDLPEEAFVEEHEEPKEEVIVEAVTDGLGRPVRCLSIFFPLRDSSLTLMDTQRGKEPIGESAPSLGR